MTSSSLLFHKNKAMCLQAPSCEFLTSCFVVAQTRVKVYGNSTWRKKNSQPEALPLKVVPGHSYPSLHASGPSPWDTQEGRARHRQNLLDLGPGRRDWASSVNIAAYDSGSIGLLDDARGDVDYILLARRDGAEMTPAANDRGGDLDEQGPAGRPGGRRDGGSRPAPCGIAS